MAEKKEWVERAEEKVRIQNIILNASLKQAEAVLQANNTKLLQDFETYKTEQLAALNLEKKNMKAMRKDSLERTMQNQEDQQTASESGRKCAQLEELNRKLNDELLHQRQRGKNALKNLRFQQQDADEERKNSQHVRQELEDVQQLLKVAVGDSKGLLAVCKLQDKELGKLRDVAAELKAEVEAKHNQVVELSAELKEAHMELKRKEALQAYFPPQLTRGEMLELWSMEAINYLYY